VIFCKGPHKTDKHELFGDTEKRPETSYTCDRCGGPHRTESHELFGDTEGDFESQEPKIEAEKEFELTEEEQRQIYNALSFYVERSDGLEKKDEKIIKNLLANKFIDLEK